MWKAEKKMQTVYVFWKKTLKNLNFHYYCLAKKNFMF